MREILDQHGFAAHQDHFEAVVVVKMDMNARPDRIVVLMLQLREFLRQQACMVIVNQRYGPVDFSIRRPRFQARVEF